MGVTENEVPGPLSPTDSYEEMGEFHDLFMDAAWNRLRPVLGVTFGDLHADAVVVDLGAGTGIGTRALAESTVARIVAVEPSLTMRAVLTARVADDPRLSARVTIHAGSAPAALTQIAGPIDGFVCAHVLGHLAEPDRAATFAWLGQSLAPNGRGVVIAAPDPDEDAGDESAATVTERRIGDLRYSVRHLATGEPGTYCSEYSVLDGERTLRVSRFRGRWESLTVGDVARELAPHGLTVDRQLPGVGVVRRAPAP